MRAYVGRKESRSFRLLSRVSRQLSSLWFVIPALWSGLPTCEESLRSMSVFRGKVVQRVERREYTGDAYTGSADENMTSRLSDVFFEVLASCGRWLRV
jgi:hypothetical protein